MSEPGQPIQEDELHAYVDDRLGPSRRAEIARALTQDPALAARIEAWQANAEALRAAFAFKLREPVPPALHVGRLAERRVGRRSFGWGTAATVLLALGVGGAAGWFGHDLQGRDDIGRLTRQASSAHLVFATETAQPVGPAPDDQATLVRWMSDRLGHPIDVPDLRPLGYRFIGGRLLAALNGPAAMLLYDAPDGSRISVYVQPMHGAPVTPMRPVADHAVGGYAWIASQVGFSVMAGGDLSLPEQTAIHRLANKVRDDLKAAG